MNVAGFGKNWPDVIERTTLNILASVRAEVVLSATIICISVRQNS